MRTIEVSPVVADAAQWLDKMIESTPHGEVSITYRLHADRAPLEERHVLTRVKHADTGKSEARHDRRDR